MNTALIPNIPRYALLSALCAASLAFGAPLMAGENEGYAADSSATVVRNNFGECVRTSSWSEEITNAQCDPEKVAVAEPAPEPQRTIQRINLASDTYFAFDKAELSEDGKAKLDEMVADIQGKQEPRLQITGYTDRIGTEDYNMDLSQRRAEAVKNYLVSKGVDTQIIETTAMGPKDPIVSCEGKTGNELIRCLSPNRRTIIEFSAFEVVEPKQPR